MIKVYYLSTCDTCRRIMKEVLEGVAYDGQDLKINQIGREQLSQLYELTGSYEALFNKRARKYSAIKEELNSDDDYGRAILEEYTFLKRPVFVVDGEVFVGNSKQVVGALKDKLANRDGKEV